MTDWKRDYEDSADAELARYTRLSVDVLLSEISAGRVGEYHTIWGVTAGKGSASQIALPLYEVLLSDRPYLDRYHCAAALLRVLQCDEFEPVALSANWPTRQQNLLRLGELVRQASVVRDG